MSLSTADLLAYAEALRGRPDARREAMAFHGLLFRLAQRQLAAIDIAAGRAPSTCRPVHHFVGLDGQRLSLAPRSHDRPRQGWPGNWRIELSEVATPVVSRPSSKFGGAYGRQADAIGNGRPGLRAGAAPAYAGDGDGSARRAERDLRVSRGGRRA